jgi:hypothetical protein
MSIGSTSDKPAAKDFDVNLAQAPLIVFYPGFFTSAFRISGIHSNDRYSNVTLDAKVKI